MNYIKLIMLFTPFALFGQINVPLVNIPSAIPSETNLVLGVNGANQARLFSIEYLRTNIIYYGSGVQVIFPGGNSTNYNTMENAFSVATTNCIIQLGQQTFYPTKSLIMPTNSVLIGNNSTVIWTNFQNILSTNGSCIVISDNCQVKNISFIDTNNNDAGAYLNFISRNSGSATNWLIENCRMEGVIDCIIFSTNKLQGTIRNCRFGSAYDCIAIYSPNGTLDPRTTNTFDILVNNCKFFFDTRNSGIPEPLAANSVSGRIRYYNCEFINSAPGSINLSLFSLDTITNFICEFYNCSSTEQLPGISSSVDKNSKPRLFNCNFLSGANVTYQGTNSLVADNGFIGNGAGLTNNNGYRFSSTNLFVSTLTQTNSTGVYTFSHSLGATPTWVRVVLYCNSNDAQTSCIVGDEVDMTQCIDSTSFSPSAGPGFNCIVNGTSIIISTIFYTGQESNLLIPVKNSPPPSFYNNTVDFSRWRLKVYAKSVLQ